MIASLFRNFICYITRPATAPRIEIVLARGFNLDESDKVLDDGQPVIDMDSSVIKFGDGVRVWKELPVTGELPDYAMDWYRERTKRPE